jgi:hypothetical protein
MECQEKNIQRRQLKKLFVTQKPMVGELKSAVAMPGVEFTAQIMTRTVDSCTSGKED